MIALSLWLLLAPQPAAPAAGCWRASVQEMIAAERAFARMSAERGIREAFLVYLADDAVILRPGPVPGRPRYEALPRERSQASLAWAPELADLAASCDLGVSAGGWEYRRDHADAESAVFGHFVSLWRRQADATWKVIFDGGGCIHAKPVAPPAALTIAQPPAPASDWSEAVRAAAVEELRGADRQLWRLVAGGGLAAAFEPMAAERLWYFPERGFPAIGKRRALAALPSPGARWETELAGAGASLAGDFGYTLGTSRRSAGELTAPEAAETGGYLIVWRRVTSGAWRVVLFTSQHVSPPQTAAPHPAS